MLVVVRIMRDRIKLLEGSLTKGGMSKQMTKSVEARIDELQLMALRIAFEMSADHPIMGDMKEV